MPTIPEPTINGDRLRLAREIRALNQTELASLIDVQQATVARLETGERQTSPDVLEKIESALGFSRQFLARGSIPHFPLGSLLFRARASMTAKQEAQARRYAQLAFELVLDFSKHVKELPLKVPQIADTDPETASRITRASLGLAPDLPIDNLTNAIERAGVIVFSVPVELPKRFAFSGWAGDGSGRPLIAICGNPPGDRLRFSVAHELGHLVMHRAFRGRVSEVEQSADAFAAELLMPAESLSIELTRPVTLSNLSALKARWRVALQALARRAQELRVMNMEQYKYLMKQISARGWRTKEPVFIPAERPRSLREMAQAAYGSPVPLKQIAETTDVPMEFVSLFLRNDDGPNAQPRNNLTLVRRPVPRRA